MNGDTGLRARDFWPAGLITLISWLIAFWYYPRLPERVPIHWGAGGLPDGYGSRLTGVLVWPLVISATTLLFALLPAIDPRRRHYAHFRTPYLLLAALVLGFFLVLQLVTMGATLSGGRLDLGRIIVPGIGLLFLGLGFALPRLRSNWFVGIRTPWTLEDERVWAETHRFGGRVFAVLGLLMLLGGGLLRAPAAIGVLVACAVLGALAMVVYSYLRYRAYHPPEASSSGSR